MSNVNEDNIVQVVARQQEVIRNLATAVERQEFALAQIMSKLDNLAVEPKADKSKKGDLSNSSGSSSTQANISYEILGANAMGKNHHGNAGNSGLNIGSFTDVIKRHDYRESPKPEYYNINSGRSFTKFLTQFETYCASKFPPETFEQWTGELGTFLQGDILEVYKAYGGSDNEYSSIKLKLIRYCREADEEITANKHNKFLYAQRQPGEKLHHYALRLEQLFLAANPNRNTGNSCELLAHFMKTIPSEIAHELEKDLSLMKAISGTLETPWHQLMKLLRNKSEDVSNTITHRLGENPEKPVNSPSIWYSSGSLLPRQDNLFNRPYGGVSSSGYASGQLGSRNYYSGFPQATPSDRTGSFYPASHNRNYYPRSPGRGRGASRSRVFHSNHYEPERTPLICGWCDGEGHHESKCRRRLGLCIRCGSSEHFIRECPKASRYKRSQSGDRKTSRTEYLDNFPRFVPPVISSDVGTNTEGTPLNM